MIAGSLEIQLAMNLARLTKDMAEAKGVVGGTMREMNSAISTVKTALGALGVGFGVGYFVNFLKTTSDTVAHMKELGQEAGTTGASFSRFEAPVRSAGLSMETLAAAIFRSNTALLEAKDPQSKAAQAFNAIGLSTEKFKGLKPDEIFEMIARSISKYSDGLAKNNVMQELFGKSGREMNRVIAEIAEKQTLQTSLTDEQIEASKKLNDQLLELKMTSESTWRSLVSEGVPALNEILKSFNEARKEGGLLEGAIAATSKAFDMMAGSTLESRLAKVNERIKNIQETTATWKTSGQVEEAKQLNNLLAMRKIIEGEIFDREMAAEIKRQEGIAKGLKPSIQFDPAAREAALKRELHIMKQRQDAQDEFAKSQYELDKHNADSGNAAVKRDEEYQDLLAKAAMVRQQRYDEAEAKAEEDIAKQARRTQEIGRELGFTFASAFEDAVVRGNSFRDVLKGIEQDILRIIIRRSVTEPAAALFTGYLGSFGSLFGGATPGPAQLAGPGFAGSFASGTDYVPRTGMAFVHEGERITPRGEAGGIRISNTYNIDSRSDRAEIIQAIEAGDRRTVAFIAGERVRHPTGPLG